MSSLILFCGSVWIYTPPPLTNTRSADSLLAQITSPERLYRVLQSLIQGLQRVSYINSTSFFHNKHHIFHRFSTGNKLSAMFFQPFILLAKYPPQYIGRPHRVPPQYIQHQSLTSILVSLIPCLLITFSQQIASSISKKVAL